jgi:RNA recognition motif-containing protein
MANLPNKRLFVGSIPFKFTEGELLTLFVPFGRITALRIIYNQWGKSRGMGYVEYDSLDSAIAAKGKMHNFMLQDRTIIVDYAQPDPYLTPEGQARHEEALTRKGHHLAIPGSPVFPKRPFIKKISPETEKEPDTFKPKSYWQHQRQSVFDSRFHHAKVGAKFAARTKKK